MTKRSLVRVCCVVAAMFYLHVPAQAAEVEDVLTYIPADTKVVVTVRNPRALSDKLAAIAKKHGITQKQPMAADLLNGALEKLKLEKLCRQDAEFAVAMWQENNALKNLMFLVPVKDYAAFAAALPNIKREDGVETFQFAPNAPRLFIAQVGGYAVISMTEAALRNNGENLAGRSKSFDAFRKQHDIAMLQRLDMLGAEMQGMARAGFDQMRQGLRENAEKEKDPKAARGLRSVVSMMDRSAKLMDDVLGDLHNTVSGVSVSQDSIVMTTVYEMKAGSQSAKFLSSLKNTDEPLLRGLPAGNYTMAAGFAMDGKAWAERFQNMTADAVAELKKENDEIGEVAKAYEAWSDLFRSMSGSAMAMRIEMANGTTTTTEVVTIRGDAEAMNAAVMKGAKAFRAAKAADPKQANADEPFKFTALDRVAGGVSFHKIEMVKENKTFYAAPVTATTTVITSETDEARLTAVAKAAKANTDLSQSMPGIAEIDRLLPKKRLMVIYGWMDQIAKLSNFATAESFKGPPVAMAASTTDDGGYRIDMVGGPNIVDGLGAWIGNMLPAEQPAVQP